MSSAASEVLEILEDHAEQDFCIGCPFGGPKVGSKGDPKSPIVFVAESPGIEEVKQKVGPLVGTSGRIFHIFVPDGEKAPYILNAMECRPLGSLKKEPKMNEAAMCCRERLLDKVKTHPRRLIVAMGNPAVRSLTGDFSLKITQIRGRLIPSPMAELGILPVVHIAALMRGTGSFRQWKQDIQYAMELGNGASPRVHIPAKVINFYGPLSQEYVDALFNRMGKGLTADIETSSLDHRTGRILSIGITPRNDLGISYAFLPIHLPLLRYHLEDDSYGWCWHNGKFDVKFLRRAGVRARVNDDTMLMSYTQDEVGGVHDLETVSGDVLGAPDYKYMIQPYLPNKKASYSLIPYPILTAYQAIDTSNTAQIREIYRERIRKEPALEKLYTKTLLPASEMLIQVEENGICTDAERLEENEGYFAVMKRDIEHQIQEMVGTSINPGSPKQVKRLLFYKLRMPNRKKGSTDKSVLKWLQEKTEHPVLALILKHRTATKMYGTYVKGIKRFVHEATQRLYATFLVHGTRTGRLAARDPNLQNPPRDPQIRGTFVAAPGYEFVEVDLSQAELRSLAALSGDPALSEVFLSGGSPHKDLAIHLFNGWERDYERYLADPGNPLWLQSKEDYTKCKNVNFGIMYGITAFGLMEQINDTKQVAQDMLDGWADRYPTASKFIQKCRDTVKSGQVMTTCFGRKKRIQLVTYQNLNFLQNEAANFPHQSIASDITLHAAIRTWRELLDMGVRIVNLIHDALLLEVPITHDNHIRDDAIALVRCEMAQVPKDWGVSQEIPFESEGEVGHRWGSLRKAA
ncbi:MAG: DNA polymerase [Dehalococcoidales bacterium]